MGHPRSLFLKKRLFNSYQLICQFQNFAFHLIRTEDLCPLFPASNSVYSTLLQLTVNKFPQKLLIVGFEPRSSSIWSDRFANCATTTSHDRFFSSQTILLPIIFPLDDRLLFHRSSFNFNSKAFERRKQVWLKQRWRERTIEREET